MYDGIKYDFKEYLMNMREYYAGITSYSIFSHFSRKETEKTSFCILDY